jgi:hypothetical protein
MQLNEATHFLAKTRAIEAPSEANGDNYDDQDF